MKKEKTGKEKWKKMHRKKDGKTIKFTIMRFQRVSRETLFCLYINGLKLERFSSITLIIRNVSFSTLRNIIESNSATY